MAPQVLPSVSVLIAKLRDVRREAVSEVDRQLYREALLIFRASQKIVPVDKGILRSSGVVEHPKNGEVIIGYGGPAASYALIVHEDLEARHKQGKTAKYLERPFMAALAEMDRRIASSIDQAIESGPMPDAGDASIASFTEAGGETP